MRERAVCHDQTPPALPPRAARAQKPRASRPWDSAPQHPHAPNHRPRPQSQGPEALGFCTLRITFALILILALAPPARAQSELKKYTSQYYDVYTDADRAEAAVFGNHMDRVFAEYAKRFAGFAPKFPDRKMALYLFKEQDQYLNFLKARGIDGANSAGLFAVTRSADGLFTWLHGKSKSSTFDILEHEGFHQFALIYLGANLPVWVNEGLAQYFEDGILIRGNMQLGLVNDQRLYQVQAALKDNYPLVDFDDLFDMTNKAWIQTLNRDPKRSALLYSYAWSVVYFLIHAEHGKYRAAFGQYLNRVAGGDPSSKAFREVFGLDDMKPLRAKWAQFILHAEPDAVSVALSRMEFLGSALRSMHKAKVPMPKTLAELRDDMRRVNFRAYYLTHGVRVEYHATDPKLYKYTARNGVEQEFELLEPSRNDLPPRITARGLKPQATLIWSFDKDGALVQEFEYR
jgi:Protein of unknown function (DUF1570)